MSTETGCQLDAAASIHLDTKLFHSPVCSGPRPLSCRRGFIVLVESGLRSMDPVLPCKLLGSSCVSTPPPPSPTSSLKCASAASYGSLKMHAIERRNKSGSGFDDSARGGRPSSWPSWQSTGTSFARGLANSP